MSGIGHNNGPSMQPGYGFRKMAWGKARRALLPQLPLEVIRRRVARAKELGLPYEIYATVHATSGRDITAFLFSTNALRMLRAGQAAAPERITKTAALVRCQRHIAVQPPLDLNVVHDHLAQQGASPDLVLRAPAFGAPYRDMVAAMQTACAGLPRDAVVLIGDTAEERHWSVAGKLAGFVASDQFFATP